MYIRVRLANPPVELVSKYTRKEREFFTDYAETILQLISSGQVQTLLEQLVNAEGIRIANLIDLRVMMFPARPLNGRPRTMLHGSYNHDASQISLYPLKIPREWIRKTGFELFKVLPVDLSDSAKSLLRNIQISSLSTLIHEVLHVKFGESGISRYVEEAIVRKLEKKYMEQWQRALESLLVS